MNVVVAKMEKDRTHRSCINLQAIGQGRMICGRTGKEIDLDETGCEWFGKTDWVKPIPAVDCFWEKEGKCGHPTKFGAICVECDQKRDVEEVAQIIIDKLYKLKRITKPVSPPI